MGWRMRRSEEAWGGIRSIAVQRPDLVKAVLAEVTDRAVPMTAGQVEAALAHDIPRSKDHWGWNWSEVKRACEYLFYSGDVASAGRTTSFERRYALPSRVLPREVLAGREPTDEEAFLELVRIAARAHGVATEACLRDYFRMSQDDTGRGGQRAGGLRRAAARRGGGLVAPGLPAPRGAHAPRRPRAGAAGAFRPAGLVPLAGGAPLRLPLPDRDLRARRASGCSATTCCPSCSASGWWPGWTSRPTGWPPAARACCGCARRSRSRPAPPETAVELAAELRRDGRLARPRRHRVEERGDLAVRLVAAVAA